MKHHEKQFQVSNSIHRSTFALMFSKFYPGYALVSANGRYACLRRHIGRDPRADSCIHHWLLHHRFWIVFLTNAPLVINGVFHIIPLADRFITNTATPEMQSQFARTIHTAHVVSAYGAVLMIVLQIFVIIHLQRLAEKK